MWHQLKDEHKDKFERKVRTHAFRYMSLLTEHKGKAYSLDKILRQEYIPQTRRRSTRRRLGQPAELSTPKANLKHAQL